MKCFPFLKLCIHYKDGAATCQAMTKKGKAAGIFAGGWMFAVI
jgi:hypothetical protein